MKKPVILFILILIACISPNLMMHAQDIFPITVNTEVGKLEFILGKDKDIITDLTLKGNINGNDIATIRSMSKLSVLNMADVNIREGGSFSAYGEILTTKNDILPRYMLCYLRNLTSVTVPKSITLISSRAFQGCTGLTALEMPNGVTRIDSEVFADCIGIKTITIPNSLTYLEEEAFKGCTGLTSVIIDNCSAEINTTAFINCTALKEYIVSESSDYYSSSEGVLFNKETSCLLAFPNAKSTTYTIGDNITSIRNSAFRNCIKLTSVNIGKNVTSIGGGAFSGCTELAYVTIPNSITSIGGDAFYGCSKLSSITIPKNVTSIGEYAFSRCTGLKEIHNNILIPTNITSDSFSESTKSECKLYVPKGTSEAYSRALVWQDFGNIIEEVTTAISDIESSNVNVYSEQGSIIVSGGKLGDYINVYNVSGTLLHSIKVTDEIVRINATPQNLYLVKAGNNTFKVAL